MSVIWKPKHRSHINVPAPRTVIKRPIPDSGLRVFGQWITTYNWRPVLEASGVQNKTDTLLRDSRRAAGLRPPYQAAEVHIHWQAMDHWSHQEAPGSKTTSIPAVEILQKQDCQHNQAGKEVIHHLQTFLGCI